MVVQSVIANQFQRLSKGLAPSPPIFTLPSGENQTQIMVKTKAKLPRLKASEKFRRIQLFAVVTVTRNASASSKLNNRPASKSAAGASTTIHLSGCNDTTLVHIMALHFMA